MPLSKKTRDFPNDFMLQTVLGNVTGYEQALLIGSAPDLDSGDGSLTIWDNKFNATFRTTEAEHFINSTSVGDTQTVLVSGVDLNWNLKIQVAVLSGQTQVSIGNFLRIQAATVVGGGTPVGDVYVAETDTLTAGVPDTDTKVHSKIITPNNITRNGFFHVPAGKSAVTMAIRGTVDTGTNKSAIVHTHIHPLGLDPIISVDYVVSKGFPEFTFPTPIATTRALTGALTPVLDEKNTIEFRAEVNEVNTRVFFGADYLLVDNVLVGNQ
jgi:hypothetical protein